MLDLARRAAELLVERNRSLAVIDWFRRWLGYPEGADGLFTSGGSAASVDAFVAAREAAGHPERATVYMSDQAHVGERASRAPSR